MQSLERLEFMHTKNYVHRDLKPDNMMMGLGANSNTLHLIDFGLTKSIIDPKTKKHIPLLTGKNLIGTCRYVSLNGHYGFELSRRDDLLTLGFVMISFFKGRLPWSKLAFNKNSARFRKLGEAKAEAMKESLYKNCPPFFRNFMLIVGSLEFEECADFSALKFMVLKAAGEHNIDLTDNVFDWTLHLNRKYYNSDDSSVCVDLVMDRRQQ